MANKVLRETIKKQEDKMKEELNNKPSLKYVMDWIENDGGCEATDGCWVEPDGTCEHGKKSWALVLGLV